MKYRMFENTIDSKIETLILQTYPNLRNDYSERLSMEDRIRNNETIPPSEREALLIEPFRYLASRVEERYAKAKFDKESGFGCLTTILLTVLLGCASLIVDGFGLTQNIALVSTGLVACLGLIYTVIQLILVPSRSIQREIIPLLASTLHSLNPTQEEIAQCLNLFKMRGYRIGQKISDKKLWEAL